jgi:hypothetical protein
VNVMQYPVWQRPYRDAMQETDARRLTDLVTTTEGAIFQRLQELAVIPGNDQEKRAIKAACDDLLDLKTRILGWPALMGQQKEVRTSPEHERFASGRSRA